MRDVLLAAAVTAILVFGWFIMGKVDIFLEKCKKAQTERLEADGMTLRIGFTNPLIADSISDVLEQCAKRYPDISVCLFHGDAEDLLKKMAVHKLDIAFLSKEADIPSDGTYNIRKVVLSFTAVIMKSGEMPIEPITDGDIIQILIWMEDTRPSAAEYFVKHMKIGNVL